jgi:hypothetical protein
MLDGYGETSKTTDYATPLKPGMKNRFTGA